MPRHRGRPRKAAPRTKSGQPSRAGQQISNDLLLVQRALAMGVNPTEERLKLMKDQRCGTALGALWARHKEGKAGLSEREYLAGEEMARIWREWAAMAECQPRTPRYGEGGGGVIREPDAERWHRVRQDFHEIRQAVIDRSTLTGWHMLESILMDDFIPPRLIGDAGWARGWNYLTEAFGVLMRRFRIPANIAA